MNRIEKIGILISGIALLFILYAYSQPHYIVSDTRIRTTAPPKSHVKSTNQFIAIAYTDLTGQALPTNEIRYLKNIYESIGDVKLVEEMIIKNLLKRGDVKLPLKQDMQTEPETFIQQSYQKFFNRTPSAHEQWFLLEKIRQDTSLTPEILYMAFMTSNEYRRF